MSTICKFKAGMRIMNPSDNLVYEVVGVTDPDGDGPWLSIILPGGNSNYPGSIHCSDALNEDGTSPIKLNVGNTGECPISGEDTITETYEKPTISRPFMVLAICL